MIEILEGESPSLHASPIIFSSPMIRALLDGRKTQTRRLITRQWSNVRMRFKRGEQCLLWVKESWYRAENGGSIYRVDSDESLGSLIERTRQECGKRWTSSIHMPRWASRLTLELGAERVQRLHEISEEDAFAEGIQVDEVGASIRSDRAIDQGSARLTYARLWESLHGKGSWEANPEIIAFTFTVHRRNLDSLIGETAGLPRPCFTKAGQ
jgi:hypothetical protein